MTRPTSIVICGQPFAVQAADLGEHEVGRTHVDQQKLLIADGQGRLQERETVLHEVVHAALQMTGYEIKEGAVTALGNSLLAVLRGNPDLVAWLMEP